MHGFTDTGLHVALRGPVTRFQVLGERSSGTNFVKRLMGRNLALTPTEALGWKHGFPTALAIPPDLLVVCVVRDARDWALSMHARPWHCPPAMQALPFEAFIRAPWATVLDRPRYFAGADAAALGAALQADRHPLTGAVFDDLFALRRAKLAGLASYAARDCSVAYLRLETAQADPAGTVAALGAALGQPAADPFRPVLKRLGSRFKAAVPDRPATPETLAQADLAHLRARIDPAQEAALGYDYT